MSTISEYKVELVYRSMPSGKLALFDVVTNADSHTAAWIKISDIYTSQGLEILNGHISKVRD